jgi:hypothetical protein
MYRLLILFPFLFLSCGNNPVLEGEPEVVYKVNSSNMDDQFLYKEYKYVVRTKHVTLVTNELYKVGDTLIFAKKDEK